MIEKNEIISSARYEDNFCQLIKHGYDSYALFWGKDKGRQTYINIDSLELLTVIIRSLNRKGIEV